MQPNQENLFAEVKKKWGLNVRSAVKIRKVWRLETERGLFCLKRSILEQHELLFVQNAMDYLKARGFRSVLPQIPTLTGGGYAELREGIFLLYAWIESREADFEHAEDLSLAAGVLAELHNRSRGFIPFRSDAGRVRWGLWPAILAARCSQLAEFGERAAALAGSSTFCARFLHQFPYYYAQSHKALAALQKSPYLRLSANGVNERSLCHHDFSSRNLLIGAEGRPYLVDFDYCLSDLRLHDLANFILRLLRHDHWQPAIAAKALDLYQSHSRLEGEELEVLYLFLLWPQDFWQLGLQFFLEELPWSSERYLRALRHRAEERAEREAFLEWYRREYCGRGRV